MKHNNRGMTLIEMIVAFAILGVVSVAIFSMLLTATKTYTRLTTTIKLQHEAQLAMANVERYIVNCNEGISWKDSDKTLFLINKDSGTGTLSVQVVYLQDDGKLYYGSHELQDGKATLSTYLLAEHVTDMEVSLTASAAGEAGTSEVKQAKVTLTFERNNKTYTGTKTIALRNRPSGNYNCSLTKSSGAATVESGH